MSKPLEATEASEHADLRSGRLPWRTYARPPRRQPAYSDLRCDVVIVGAGITGALVAEHLVARGMSVVVVDRERAGYGSTAASTAMLLWEIDTPLSKLCERYGFEGASDIYRRSLAASLGLGERVRALRLRCAYHPRRSLYLAAGEIGARELLDEHRLRRRAGLPGDFLDQRTLSREFGIDRVAALLSPAAAEANPLCLAHGLLHRAVAAGASIIDDDAIDFDSEGSTVVVGLGSGFWVEAGHCVLATGYAMPDILSSSLHSITSTFAIATAPRPRDRLWRERALIWEASDNYLYARTTADDRILAGGEDDPSLADPDARDRALVVKAAAVRDRIAALWPAAEGPVDFAWSGTFGKTVDGLPLIGEVPGHRRILAAYGYGGNGITFSYLASQIVGELIAGRRHAWFDAFAIDRSP